MTIRQKLWTSLGAVVILVGLAAAVVYPKGPDITWKGAIVKELKVHLGLDLQGGTSLVYQADVSSIDSAEQADAMASVRDVLERRVNAFGVSEPVVQTSQYEGTWRVNIELPGVTDISQAIDQIGATPILEFKVEGDVELTEEQRTMIKQLNDGYKEQADTALQQVKDGEDIAQVARTSSQDTESAINGGDIGYIGKGVIDATYDEAVFNANVGEVIDHVVETDTGYYIVRVDDKTTALPADKAAKVTPETSAQEQELVKVTQVAFQKLPESASVFGANYVSTDLTGKQLRRADVQFDQTTNQPIVALTFNDEGAKMFEEITRNNIDKTIAIYLDGKAISTPVVNQVIPNGQAVISGVFTLQEAKDLVRNLNAGALPVNIELINQRNIGPSLGEEALQRSILAGIIGMIALSIFMVTFYRWPGFIAIVSLLMYGIILLAIFKLWPITLSLSGIAGFILSLGIAVDANVLIFERLREELATGKSMQKAIDDGFARAWLSIRDSNMSSLLTCVILMWFGSSVIKGFAITLGLGVVVSMFTAITITRVLLKTFAVKGRVWYGVK